MHKSDTHLRLAKNHDKLVLEYEDNLENVLSLQEVVAEDVLPYFRNDANLEEGVIGWVEEWLQDTQSMFRLLRRHKFIRSFFLESVHEIIAWRLNYLRPLRDHAPTDILHCLPLVSDVFGRPVVVLQISKINNVSSDVRDDLFLMLECLRLHLKSFNGGTTGTGTQPTSVILQYTILVDMKDVSMQSADTSLLSWFVREVIPRYPGLLAAVFILNYSWVHAGMWSVLKRLLPASTLSRVSFVSKVELLEFIPPESLPQEYGGVLPLLKDIEDPLRLWSRGPPPIKMIPASESESADSGSGAPDHTPRQPPPPGPIMPISAVSSHNPFFGYPIYASTPTPHGPSRTHSFRHGRRRMRDLLRTLLVLWWQRRRARIGVTLWVVAGVLAATIWTRRSAPLSPPQGLLLRYFWISGPC